jgi:leader peptidase (prepilin peptidase)/N-methyltransferase
VAAFGLLLAAVDVAVRRLPNKLTLMLALGAGVALTLDAAVNDNWARLAEAGACGAAAGGFYTVISVATGGGIGLGDAKLAFGLAFVAGWAGWPVAALAITLGLVLTGLTGIVLLLFTRASGKDSLPHGPFMVAGTIAAVVLANL